MVMRGLGFYIVCVFGGSGGGGSGGGGGAEFCIFKLAFRVICYMYF